MIKTIGIDIGTDAFIFVELSKFLGSRVIKAYKKVIPQESFSNGIIKELELAISFLKDFKKEAGLKSTSVSIAISGNNVFIRQFTMPNMTKKELSEAIRWEAAEYLPIPIEETVTDFVILGKDLDTNKLKVMLAALPEKLVLDYINVFNAAGLYIKRVEIAHFPLHRVFNNIYKRESCGVINIRNSTTDILIIDKGQYQAATTIDKGTETLQQIINMKNNLTSKILLEEYIDEIKRFFDFCTFQTKGLKLNKIQLTGTGVYFPGVKEIFEKIFDIPICSDFPKEILIKSRCKEFNSNPHIYSTALGLCLGGGVPVG